MCNFLSSSLEREKHPPPPMRLLLDGMRILMVSLLATLTLASFMLLGWRMETVNRKKVPAWNISQQALWIFNNTVMTSGKRHCCWLFQMCFLFFLFFGCCCFEHQKTVSFLSLKKILFYCRYLICLEGMQGAEGSIEVSWALSSRVNKLQSSSRSLRLDLGWIASH